MRGSLAPQATCHGGKAAKACGGTGSLAQAAACLLALLSARSEQSAAVLGMHDAVGPGGQRPEEEEEVVGGSGGRGLLGGGKAAGYGTAGAGGGDGHAKDWVGQWLHSLWVLAVLSVLLPPHSALAVAACHVHARQQVAEAAAPQAEAGPVSPAAGASAAGPRGEALEPAAGQQAAEAAAGAASDAGPPAFPPQAPLCRPRSAPGQLQLQLPSRQPACRLLPPPLALPPNPEQAWHRTSSSGSSSQLQPHAHEAQQFVGTASAQPCSPAAGAGARALPQSLAMVRHSPEPRIFGGLGGGVKRSLARGLRARAPALWPRTWTPHQIDLGGCAPHAHIPSR